MHGHLPLWPVFLKQIPDTYSAKDPNFSAVEPPVCTTKLLWVPYQQPVTNTVLGRLMDSRHEGNHIDLFVKSNEYDLAWLNDTVAAQRQHSTVLSSTTQHRAAKKQNIIMQCIVAVQ